MRAKLMWFQINVDHVGSITILSVAAVFLFLLKFGVSPEIRCPDTRTHFIPPSFPLTLFLAKDFIHKIHFKRVCFSVEVLLRLYLYITCI